MDRFFSTLRLFRVMLPEENTPFFRILFSPNFSRTGLYQKQAILLEPVVKTCQKEKLYLITLFFSSILCFGELENVLEKAVI